MKTYRIIYGMLLLVMSYLFIHKPYTEYMVVILLMVLFPWIGKVMLVIGSKEPAPEFYLPEEVTVGESREMEVAVWVNHGWMVGRIRILLVLDNRFSGKVDTCEVELFPERNGFRGTFPYSFCECGYIHISIKRMEFADWTGLCICRKVSEKKAGVYVYPSPLEIGNLPESREVQKGRDGLKPEMPYGPGAETSDKIRDFREYREGDSVKKIHWKLSAKAGTLLIKEENTGESDCLILLPDFEKANSDECGRILGKLMAMSEMFLQNGHEHWIGIVSRGDLKRFYMVNTEMQRSVFRRILCTPCDFGEGRVLFYRDRLTEEHLRVILVTGKDEAEKEQWP